MREMKLKDFLFILPIIILICVFSLWPICRIFCYSLFDYKLNDQQKAGLYLNEQYNVDLFNENSQYVKIFLEEDQDSLNEEGKELSRKIIEETIDVQELLEDEEGTIILSGNLKDKVEVHLDSINVNFNKLEDSYDFNNEENLKLIMEDLETCTIESNFIGFSGYKQIFKDSRIKVSLVNTVVFTFFSVFIEFILGMGLALIMNMAIKGRNFIRTTSLIPWAIPTAVAALMWSYLYDGSSGIVAYIFENINIINSSKQLLLTAGGAMTSAVMADVWKTTPYMALLLLAGFQVIPSNVYESAQIDGSGKINTFFKITLPLLKPSILVALLFRTLDAFRVFDLIYVLTGGGPGGSTETLSIYSYKLMFEQTNFGYGSIVVILMFICVAIIASIFVKILGANLMDRS